MLESAEIGHRIGKQAYARDEPALREALLIAQFGLSRTTRGPVLVIVSGVDGAGRGETANKLTEWMDPRHIRVVAFGARTPEEAVHPAPWRYWRALPPSGRLGIFMHAWYNESVRARMRGRIDDDRLQSHLQAVREHEQMLTDEGVVLLKFWIHLSKAEQKKRLKAIDRDPRFSWRVTGADWQAYRAYRKSYGLWETLLRETSTTAAPWYVVEGVDERYRNLTVGRILLDAMRAAVRPARSARAVEPGHPVTPIAPSAIDNVKLIRDLDLSKKLSARAYPGELEQFQGALARLSRHKRFRRRSLVIAFEGVDAAGKGGAIRRVTGALDARQYVTVPVAAPTDEERAHPYLWRFWRHIPPRGGITLFDRSWYGRVLVERVEHLAATADWMRAYAEINQFEEQLTQAGVIVVKFWLQISKAEQLKRFRARELTPFKRFKITPDDWRNRKRWAAYEIAVCDMVDRTSTMLAPWTLVEAEDKYYARIKVLKTIVRRIESAIER
ncbi:MAG TPA: polyphosphate:AMP phosphotransferase [Casimicrobiaceae bacterium]|jgi:polyphosphate:AMP phosphotransferase